MAALSVSIGGPPETADGIVESPPNLPGWSHSVGVAPGCRTVADRTGMREKGVLFTVGLLHDIGKIVLNEHVGAEYARIVRLATEGKVSLMRSAHKVGRGRFLLK